MKGLFLLIFSILLNAHFVFSQEKKEVKYTNPFEQAGIKNVKIATLSKGKYQEFHDLDSIVQIGTTLINVNSRKIVGYVANDSTDVMPNPTLISRWVSPDPLAEEYYSLSPYNYVANNPINSIDPDGREIIPVNLNATHSAVYQKALATKSFQSSFKGLIESRYHIVKLYSSPLYVSAGKAEYGRTTYHITEMGYPKPLQTNAYFANAEKVANEEPFKSKYSDNHAQVKLNNNLDDVGISDLAAAGTLFHEVWHTKMSMNGTGGKDNDSQHNGMTLDSYFQEKMSFMTEFAGRELTQNEQLFHQWHGLAGTVEYAEQFMNKVTDSNGNVRYEGYNEKGKAYLEAISKVNDRTGIENK